jgi:mRNA export factor
MSFFTTTSAAAAASSIGDLKSDVQVNNPPEDSISDLAFNPNPADAKDFLAVSSWDKKVRIYEILPSGQGEGRHAYEHGGPGFSVDFHTVNLCTSLPLILVVNRSSRMEER